MVSSLVFTGKTTLQESQVHKTSGKVCSKENLSVVKVNFVKEHFKKLNIQRSTEPDRMHL